MPEGTLQAQWAEIGPWGLVTLFVLSVLTGFLVPRWLHTQRMEDKDNQIKYLQSTVEKREEQLMKLLPTGEQLVRLLEGFQPEVAKRE